MRPSLAKRTDVLAAEGAYAVLSKATILEKKGKDIIHLEIGQPDFPTPKHIANAGVEAIKKGYTKYNPPLGILPLRQAIAKDVSSKKDINISSDNIAVTPSGKTAIFTALLALIEPGDEVMYPNPGFPTYQTLIDFLGAKRVPIPLIEKNNFSFDMNVFRKKFSKKTRLIILNSPSNPTGGIMRKQDLMEIAHAVKNTQCWVITDEIYDQITYSDAYTSYYGLPGVKDRTILVSGFSKTYAMTGWRIGYISAPTRIMDKIDYLLTHMVGCTATFTQHAILAALNGPKDELRNMVKEFKHRRKFVVSSLNQMPGIVCPEPAGAFYVFPNVKSFNKKSSWIANYLLEKGGVALLSGSDFGKFGEGYLRISYATSMKNLQEGIERIRISLAKL
ncbi:hypothetical protein A3H80_04820 [Candidatus Roizmanbacteria bacterium RIFCSPLOWO2_02_FULL_37_19]|uniref:Aminotransferase n=1 Tax=Candidatus Roizmanbacteria bacterium RIFCSPHIGHO2_02_FULL_37_24 TaxID=1802037 RepID=A0A1F7GXI6_9BACT|nr:MAG: hypothetical protein A2862_02160 [Candidatus Roizmanbacteria bacterium RIFCSPHIGHO2_01_FULL_38_41]OGK23202.1 MAG: hypothetical protein A3C24_00915 [Candidatus Roizmanbacteria bacterium RIFCSPHIGHO2_02_FULL_37_24]OGK32476.1 MAG: hypothetical protein A3E10_01325 [Candidatus Roizmanbacteria bacterium RIFCSPHIGHO2_12_FULL_37_23]OGK43615.1 MAG: hypothetical protein A2956_04260 [Candidatus Roizmanbacteria bacterium RIFCSPLOWO2_01_FULL_37_57]OGK54803.1 MAG: hypothetical protein A3H80_04820 [Ca